MDITELLRRVRSGDRTGLDALMPHIYGELRRLAASHVNREGQRGLMQPTTLVHEAYLRLVGSNHPNYQNRSHFYWIASRVMRQVLVDSARARMAAKRSGASTVQLGDIGQIGAAEPDRILLAMDDALSRMAELSETKASLVEMHYFGGMTAIECAEAKSMSVHMVRKELRLAQAWLRSEMQARPAPERSD